MVKHDSMINEDRNRRFIFMTFDKIMRAAAEKGHAGIMDDTFKVYFLFIC